MKLNAFHRVFQNSKSPFLLNWNKFKQNLKDHLSSKYLKAPMHFVLLDNEESFPKVNSASSLWSDQAQKVKF